MQLNVLMELCAALSTSLPHVQSIVVNVAGRLVGPTVRQRGEANRPVGATSEARDLISYQRITLAPTSTGGGFQHPLHIHYLLANRGSHCSALDRRSTMHQTLTIPATPPWIFSTNCSKYLSYHNPAIYRMIQDHQKVHQKVALTNFVTAPTVETLGSVFWEGSLIQPKHSTCQSCVRFLSFQLSRFPSSPS